MACSPHACLSRARLSIMTRLVTAVLPRSRRHGAAQQDMVVNERTFTSNCLLVATFRASAERIAAFGQNRAFRDAIASPKSRHSTCHDDTVKLGITASFA